MKKLIAVQGFTYQISDPMVQAVVTLTGVPSVKCKAGGQWICKDGFSVVVTAILVPGAGAVIPDPGPKNASFSATSQKNKADGTFVLRKDDETGTISATPKIPQPSGPPVDYPVSFKLSIINAGQTKVSGE
jgi:hypothetical protein